MRKKLDKIILIGICCLVFCSGCSGIDILPKQEQAADTELDTQTETAAVEIIETEKNGENLLNEFYALQGCVHDKEELYRFLEKHIAGTATKDADQLVNGLISYLGTSDALDYNRIAKQKQYLSEEMQKFVALMETEQNTPALVDGTIQVPLSELLERAYCFEEQAVTFPDGVTYKYAYEKYCELVTTAVTGLYDGENIQTNIYLNDDGIHIEDTAIKEYTAFISAHPASNTAAVLQEYMNLLNSRNLEADRKVEKFYQGISDTIRENFIVKE